MRTRHVGFQDAGYQLHPDWELVDGLEYSDVSCQDRKMLNRDATSGRLGVLYRNTLNSRVGVCVKYTDNDLKEREIAVIEIIIIIKRLKAAACCIVKYRVNQHFRRAWDTQRKISITLMNGIIMAPPGVHKVSIKIE